ncbi:YigZ family protein [Spiroplasma sp. SV19]|uniref:YigZ family protein n=1 Tax=Spiroplasma sp. SV19 TaxID=2570468 RepID=UPI0024B64432|nr:YigZ family protein [Spiroplasma sp. SV19]WHQ37033.1 YigZ family protein [Spiroplasma sp. SV19]
MYIIKKNKILTKELIIRNVKFLCFASYVQTETDVINFLKKYKNKKANHNAYAYVIGNRRENIYKTDNGETRHIAGKTILENIIDKNLTNIIVLVSRYFNPLYNLLEDWIKNGYATITRIILTSAQLEKINEQIKIGILLRPLNEVFLRELLDKNKINIVSRLIYRGDLIFTIIIDRNNSVLIELDNLIIKGIIYSYKILKN